MGAARLGIGGQLWSDEGVVATLLTRDTELLELFRRENLKLEISTVAIESHLGKKASQPPLTIHVILYGLEELCLGLKQVLQRTGFFLQDPIGARRDVVYFNPQRLINSKDVRTSNVLPRAELKVEEEEVSMIDVLAQFTTPIELQTTEGSNYLLTPLQL